MIPTGETVWGGGVRSKQWKSQRWSYGRQVDIAMICNIKERVECWTAPRDYHRGDSDSNADFRLKDTHGTTRHKAK